METTLMRANRVAVKANGEHFIASFYRTHKIIADIHSELTDWVAPKDVTNKTTARESFRQWIINNAAIFGIDWKPQDMRAEGNIRKAKYDSDQALIDDAMSMLIPEMRALVDKCKYPIEWSGVNHEDIEPMTHTGTGRDLSTMGITDGKYKKSGNWAWATLKFIVTFKYKGEECYIITHMQLVSGQLKKTGIGITEFNSKVKTEILDAKLATEEELDPPKEKKPRKSKDDNIGIRKNEDGKFEMHDKAVISESETPIKEECTEDAQEEHQEVQNTEEDSKPRRRRRSKVQK